MPKKAAPRRMSFRKWIEDVGTSKVAELLDVRTATVNYWKAGRCYPRVEQMRVIKKLTRGAVGYEQIIDGGNF